MHGCFHIRFHIRPDISYLPSAVGQISPFIARLADIWSCRHAQYQLGRPCHIYRRANMARANMDFHIWASLISKLLDFHSGYDCRLRFLNQLRSCPQVDHIEKLVCCRLPRWCDRYHHQIIRTYII